MEKIFRFSYILILSVFLVACTDQTSQNGDSCSYKIETGDIITISVASGYTQMEEVPFRIHKEDKLICEGSFTTELSADNYLNSLPKESRIEDENINGNEFILIDEDGQYKGFVFMNETNTVIVISYYIPKEEIIPFMRTISIVSEIKQ
ncbi:hypothetical protein DW886_15460 [Enterocloster aldenensis]|uniref:hypothetical protein n=1 Tax=Enterocloster aldenensis TaxID=358742 RepID=UPI000E4FD4A1|nr:hypothetical protein DW886_15460 [Enterocloster aldenensis]